MKKSLLVLLTTLLLLTGLFGCKKTEKEGDEPYVLKLNMSTLFIVPANEAVQTVEDEINRYLKEELGETDYVLDLTITSIGDYLQNIPMELSSPGDDSPDLIQVFTLAQFVDSGYLVNLDPYLDNELKGAVELIGNVIGSGKLAGHTYMMPRYFGTVLDWKWVYDKTLVEAAGVDVSKINDIDSLGDALAELKKVYPNEYFLVYCDQFNRLYNFKTHTSVVGNFAATVGESTQLINYYASDAFKSAIEKAYEFRQKGYADPEGSNNTLSHDAVVMGGSSKGVIMGHSADAPGIAKMFTNQNTYGATFGAVTIGIDDLSTDTLGIGISYTCKHPEYAARFMNLLYTDPYVWLTLIYGAEGQDYVWNEDRTLVSYPEGLDFNSIPYNCLYSCGMIGNGFQALPFEGDEGISGSDTEYGKVLMENAWVPPLYGFTPVTTNVMNEVTAVNNVVEQYSKVLMYGDVDPAVEYPKFLAALEAAGIDKIISDYQAQVDEWLKANQ